MPMGNFCETHWLVYAFANCLSKQFFFRLDAHLHMEIQLMHQAIAPLTLPSPHNNPQLSLNTNFFNGWMSPAYRHSISTLPPPFYASNEAPPMNQSLRHFWSSHLSSSITAPYRHSTNQILLSYLSFPTPSFSLCPLYCIVVFISVSIPRIRAFLCQPHFFSPVSPKQRNFYNTDMFSYRVSYTDLGTSLDSLK